MTWVDGVKSAFWIGLMGVSLFGPAGTLDWPGAWIFMAEFVIGGVAIIAWLMRHDPGLLRERMGGLFQKGQAVWDKLFVGFIVVVWYGWLALMALDARRWDLSRVPDWVSGVGAALVAVGFYVVWLTFRANSFAAPVVKIQRERGQHVVSTGPYAIVRHPMYAGASLYMIGMPLLLGSWIGLLVLPLILAALTGRIFLEEAALRDGLPGYADYAARVRFRLMPGVW